MRIIIGIGIICGLFVTVGMTLSSFGPSLTSLAAASGSDLDTLGALFTCFSLGAVLSQFVIGPLSDRLDLRWLIAAGAGLFVIGSSGLAWAINLPIILSGAFVGGLGFGSILNTANMFIARLLPQRSASMLNLTNVFYGVGAMLGPLIVSITLREYSSSLPGLWFSIGLLGLLCLAFPLLPGVEKTTGSSTSPRPMSASGSPWLIPLVWMLGLTLLIYTGIEIAMGAWAARYLELSTGIDPIRAPLAVSGFWLALTIGRIVGAGLALRLNAQQILALCFSGSLIAMIGFVFSGSLIALAIGSLLLMGLCFGPIFPTIIADTAAKFPKNSGAVTGVVLALANGGGMVLPWLTGFLLNAEGPNITGLMLVGCTVVMGALFIAGGSFHRRFNLATR